VQCGKLVGFGTRRIVAVLVDVDGAAFALVMGIGCVQPDDVAGIASLEVADQASAGQLALPRQLSASGVIHAPGVASVYEPGIGPFRQLAGAGGEEL
jgi:hypothetical protein